MATGDCVVSLPRRMPQPPVTEQERTARQIASLEAVVAAIVEASELMSTDDEHDPEGPTIAYERARPAHCCDKRVRTATHSTSRADSSSSVSKSSVRPVVVTSLSNVSPRSRPPRVVSRARPDRRSGTQVVRQDGGLSASRQGGINDGRANRDRVGVR
jgi:hypothetical protein